MSHELICTCLRLAPKNWPPDHYTLLGLEPGEANVVRIERHAQQRLERLRRYQLTHAEQVTEGMNRLAQALVCLTDPVAKRAYDAALLTQQPFSPSVLPPPRRAYGLRDEPPAESWAGPEGEDGPVFDENPVPRRPSWLFFAWALWLCAGLVGLAALVAHYPAIKESYYGIPKTEAKKSATSKNSKSTPAAPR